MDVDRQTEVLSTDEKYTFILESLFRVPLGFEANVRRLKVLGLICPNSTDLVALDEATNEKYVRAAGQQGVGSEG